jgi:hypothetical protein
VKSLRSVDPPEAERTPLYAQSDLSFPISDLKSSDRAISKFSPYGPLLTLTLIRSYLP